MSSPQLPLLPATTYSPPRAHPKTQLSLHTNFADQGLRQLNDIRDEASPDPRDFYLQYHDPFGSDGAGPDDIDLTSSSFSRKSSGLSNGSPTSQRYRPSARSHQYRSTSAAYSNERSPSTSRPPPTRPPVVTKRQTSLRDLVNKFNQAHDEVPPRPGSVLSSRAASPAPSNASFTRPKPRNTNRSTSGGATHQSTQEQPPPLATHRSNRDTRRPSTNNYTGPSRDNDCPIRTPSSAVRKPLFGEILPVDSFAAHQERRARRRGSDGCMHSPNPMLLDTPIDVSAGLSPISPTAWYLGYTPFDATHSAAIPLAHRRSRSDISGNSSHPITPIALATTMGIPHNVTPVVSPVSPAGSRQKSSRIPIAARRHSHTSESGSSCPPTRASSALDRHPANVALPPRGISALPKPSPKQSPKPSPKLSPSPKFRGPGANAPAPLRITSPRRRDGNQPNHSQKSPALKAYISAPPPKKSPQLRSSRPRQPVSTATTSASRAKVVDRVSEFQGNTPTSRPSPLRTTRQKSKRLPELGNVDFAARRQRIQQAFNKSVEENNKKETAKKERKATAQRLKDAAEKDEEVEDGERKEPLPHEPQPTPTENPAPDVPTVVDSPDDAREQDVFVTPEESRSPNLPMSTVNNGETLNEDISHQDNEIPRAPQTPEPVQPLTVLRPATPESDMVLPSAATTTPIDAEPQDDFPQPSQSHRTMLNHILQMREFSPSASSSEDDSSSEQDDKESIQIMLRQTYYDDSLDTSSENQESGDCVEESRLNVDRQRWSMSSWSSSIQNNQPAESFLPNKAERLPAARETEDMTTPQPPFSPPSTINSNELRPNDDLTGDSKRSSRVSVGDAFGPNMMQRYPDLAKHARWDTKRATQLYLQKLVEAGYSNPRFSFAESESSQAEPPKQPEQDVPQYTDGLTEDPVMVPESNTIPPSDYVPHCANLNLRDDWERASPSIADWMHLAATDKEAAEEPSQDRASANLELEGAMTPRISTPASKASKEAQSDGLGLSIHVRSADGDSPTLPPPPIPGYAPPPPPVVKNVSTEQLNEPALVEASPSIYPNDPPSSTIPSAPAIPVRQSSITQSSEESSLRRSILAPSAQTLASSATSQDRSSVSQPSIEVPPPRKSPTPEQRRLKKRSNVIKELVDTEYTFGQDMTVVVDIYKGTASSCSLTAEEVKTLFGNSDQIVQFSMDFQDALKQATKSVYVLPKSQRWRSKRGSRHLPAAENHVSTDAESSNDEKDRKTGVGQAFMEHIGRMEKVYSEYLRNHEAANKALESFLKTKNKNVTIWLKECRDWASDLTTAWNLDSLLVKPVQRIVKYPLLLTELLSATPNDHPDHAAIANALRETTAISVRINEMKKRADVVGQVVSRKRKESDVRTGLSKAFGRRTEKLKQHVGLSEMFTDKDYDLASQQFGDNFFQLQLIMRDVELYITETQNATNRFNEFVLAIEAYISVAPSNYPEIESKWCRFRLAVKDVMTVALVDHLASVRKSVINPMVTLLKLHDGPQRVMQKRNKRLLDYVKYKAIKSRGDKPDKKTTELGEQFIALNVTLKEELPKLLSLTGKLMEACLNNFVQLQTTWHTLIQKRLGYTIDRIPEEVSQIISDWAGDFSFSEAQVLSLGVCNGSILAETANISSPSTTVDASSSRRPSTVNSNATRGFSFDTGSSPKVSHDFGASPPSNYMHNDASGHAQHSNGAQAFGGRSRTNSNFSGRGPVMAEVPTAHIPSMASIMNSSTRTSVTPSTGGSSNSYRTSDASPVLPQLALDTPRLPEFFPNRNGPPDITEHPSSPDAPRYSGFFSSAMPMAETPAPVVTGEAPAPAPHEPKVLFLAASMFEFNIDRARREAGYPYLTYVAGEIFDVIGEKGDLWLAKNQDDPTHQVGWIWTKHFAKLAG